MANETDTKSTSLDLLSNLVAKAMKAGASAADAVTRYGVALSVSQRLGKREDLERSEGQDMGLRVFVGKQQAMVATPTTVLSVFISDPPVCLRRDCSSHLAF